MKKAPTQSLGEILGSYQMQGRMMVVAGLSQRISVDSFVVVVRTLHAGEMPVEVNPCGLGIQLWDPQRKTPVGWILKEEE